ncbi:exo-beta-N-acetylmuramidase NamZ domain-containing protein, partial [Acidobacteriota bacterium]
IISCLCIPMEGWNRKMWYDQTGLPWVIPSPNMPSLETAAVYPGQVFIEGTNISEGRGTTKPFELFGAPWIDGHELAAKLNSLQLPGVSFREAWFTPTFSKYTQELCGGCQIHVTERAMFRSFSTTLHIIKTIKDLYPDKFQFHPDYFDKIMGTAKVRLLLEEGRHVSEMIDGFRVEIAEFERFRKDYLIYD